MPESIVNIRSMGDALRNVGYKNIESAAAEIIDNSVEAGATDILIIITEDVSEVTHRRCVKDIAFLDNGVGMDSRILSTCLGIGSTTRSERKGIGRFGVGLPQASLYATPHVDVYSWQNGYKYAKKVYLDINEVKTGKQDSIPDPIETGIPKKYEKFIHYNLEDGHVASFGETGTLVVWKDCDRLDPKTIAGIVNRFNVGLGQKFRYFLNKDKVRMWVVSTNDSNYQRLIVPNDPLLLMENNFYMGTSAGGVDLAKDSNDAEPIFEPFTDGDHPDGIVHQPVKYFDRNGDIKEGVVDIRFSIVKPKFYDETAVPGAKNPGTGPIGKSISKLTGISVVRADREIDFGEFDYFSNVNNPNNRWWGCEIQFDPELDEAFKVANNKQHVELKAPDDNFEDIDDGSVKPMWVQLYPTVFNTINKMIAKNKAVRKSTRKKKTDENQDSIVQQIVKSVEGSEASGAAKKVRENDGIDKIIAIINQERKEVGEQPMTDSEIKYYLNQKIDIKFQNGSKLGPFFEPDFTHGTVNVNINTNSSFYKEFLEKMNDEDSRIAFYLMLASYAMAVNDTNVKQQAQNDLLMVKWDIKMREYMQKFEDLKGQA